jgi:hypothetical protein
VREQKGRTHTRARAHTEARPLRFSQDRAIKAAARAAACFSSGKRIAEGGLHVIASYQSQKPVGAIAGSDLLRGLSVWGR